MKIYSFHGINEFVICCGYKGYMIKEYFSKYHLHMSDLTFDMAKNEMKIHQNHVEPWKVTLIDTGEETMTGGRLKRVKDYIGDETFCMTYGDGVSDINIGKLASFTAIRIYSRRLPPYSLRGDSERSTSTTINRRSSHSRRSLMATAPGSTAAFSCSSQGSCTTSTATRRSGSGSRWRIWRETGCCRPIGTRDSGNPWIP